jgi:hypothetical protein
MFARKKITLGNGAMVKLLALWYYACKILDA